MVYNEMSHVMPSNGFGSPFSPPDALLEGREVPSPSQYSDPSTPPSLHSPPHYYSDAEKTENPMKEEPHSPYTFGTATLLSVPTSVYQQQQHEPLHHEYQQYQHQYMYQQQNKVIPNEQQLEQRKPFEDNRKLEQHFTQEMLMKIEQALNDPGFDTLDCLLQASTAEASDNFQQISSQSYFGQGSQQQQSFRQEHGHQTPEMISNENLINPEIFTAISVPQMTPPRDDAVQEAQNIQNGNCNAYALAETANAGDASSFQTGYKSNTSVVSNDIKMEVEDLQNLDMDNLEDSIMAGIMNAAGISHNLAEWSNVDVRSFMRACVEYLAIPEPIRDTDGRTLISMSKEQFINWMGVVEASPWHELLFVWITKHKKVDMKDGGNSSVPLSISEPLIQVKQEALHAPEMKMVKQEMALNMMLPVTVTSHNQAQCHMTQFKIGQNNVHTAEIQASQKQSVQLNQKHERQYQEYLLAHQLQENQHNRFQPQTIKLEQVQLQQQLQSNLSVQSFQLKQSQHQYSPEPQQQQQSFLTQRSPLHQSNIITVVGQTPCHIQHPNSISTPQHGAPASLGHNNPSSPSDSAHIPLLQTGLSSGAQAKGSCPGPQQDGVDYIDESGTDLSVLLQPTPPHQHPTTIDQDENMETDEEGEDDPPVSSTGTTGRTHIQLWQFLKELLNNNKKYGSCIRWLDRQEAIFKIEDSVKVANLWGERKNRPQMNYDKLSRSIRQYYNKNIMKKTERSQRLVYQFCTPYGQ